MLPDLKLSEIFQGSSDHILHEMEYFPTEVGTWDWLKDIFVVSSAEGIWIH